MTCILLTILVAPERRDSVMQKIKEKEIGVAVNFRAIHLLAYYRQKYGFTRGMFPNAENIGDGTITLPLYPKLREEEIDYVIKSVNEITQAERPG